MPKKGRNLETLVKGLEEILAPKGFKIKSPDLILGKNSGSMREVDISLKYDDGLESKLIFIECRNRHRAQNTDWVDGVIGKKLDIGANGAIIVSSSRFSQGAINNALNNNIKIRTLLECSPEEIGSFFQFRYLDQIIQHSYFFQYTVNLFLLSKDREIDKLKIKCPGFNEKCFFEEPAGKLVSLRDIWKTVDNESFYFGLPENGDKLRRPVRIIIDQEKVIYSIQIEEEKVYLDSVDAIVDFWIEKKQRSCVFKQYRNEGEKIFDIMESKIIHNDQPQILTIVNGSKEDITDTTLIMRKDIRD